MAVVQKTTVKDNSCYISSGYKRLKIALEYLYLREIWRGRIDDVYNGLLRL
jgi:hypothetical protein